MTEQSLLHRLIFRLRPSLAQLEGVERDYAILAVLPVILMGPFAAGGIVGLVAVTRWSQLVEHGPLIALLLVALLVVRTHNYSLYIELNSGDLVRATGSLDMLLVWSNILIAGPVVLWSPLIVQIIRTTNTARTARQRNQPANPWMSASLLAQETSEIGFSLLALAIFHALGGTYPLDGLALADWGPAATGLLVSSLLSQIVYYPFTRAMSALAGQAQITLFTLFVLTMSLVLIPFSILGALICARGGAGLFVLYLAWIVLVNGLAYYLSRTNELSQQRARELRRLEALGEALI